jgi:benzodiazapine receptor
MPRAPVLFAVLIAIAYVFLTVSGSLVNFSGSTEALMLRVNFRQPAVWLVAIIGTVVAWGLWQRYSWAWWLGLAAAAFQLFRMGQWLVGHGFSRLPGWHFLLMAGLLIAFVVLLLTQPARAACSR